MPRVLSENQRIKDAVDQLKRYGYVRDERILDVLDLLTSINDDMHHGRHRECIDADVAKIKDKLDALASDYAVHHNT
jgi:uncharacterized protein YacL